MLDKLHASSIGALLASALLVSSPAQAVTVEGADLLLEIGDEAAKVWGVFQDQFLTGNRQAIARAKTPKTSLDIQGKSTTFFGDMETQIAFREDDTPAFGLAQARNVLKGKVWDADADGGGQARADLLWKGELQLTAFDGDPLPPPVFPKAPALQNAGAAPIRAFVLLNYTIDSMDISGSSNLSGAFEGNFSWGGIESFNGAVRYERGTDDGKPFFEGDLLAYETSFGSHPFQISASALAISSSLLVPIDYLAFYQSGEVEIDFEGALSVAVTSSVPLPSGF